MPNIVALEDVSLSKDIEWALRHYRKLAERGSVGDNHTRMPDYLRWSLVYDRLPDDVSLIDVGIGAGQFVNAAARSGRFDNVIGVDYRRTSGLQEVSVHWTLVIRSLAARDLPDDLNAQVVTCMECIEHIGGSLFDVAVRNLKRMARERLIVTVPFEEPEPLPPYHKQRFDQARLEALFPGSDLTLITRRGAPLWALVDWRAPAQRPAPASAHFSSGISGSPQAVPATA